MPKALRKQLEIARLPRHFAFNPMSDKTTDALCLSPKVAPNQV